MITTTSLKQIEQVLMQPESLEQDKKVTIPKGLLNHQRNLAYFTFSSDEADENLTFLLPGRNGPEFNKTLGFFYKYPGVLIYKCIYGSGIMLIQKNDQLSEAKEIRVASLRPGVEIEVPSGYGHTIINTGRTFLVLIDNGPQDEIYKDQDTIIKKRGLVYYVIDKKGEVGFEKNLHYSYHPQILSY